MEKTKDNFIMLPTVDFCFKELMQNEKVRLGILSALLNKKPEEIASTELLPTFLRKRYADDKYGILDVHIRMKDGTQIDMEMQVSSFDFWESRILFYLGKMFTDQLNEGDDYDMLKRCIHVSILDFVHFPNDKDWYHHISWCDEDTGEKYTDLMEIYVMELKKLPPEDQNEEGIIRWMRFFGGKCREDFQEMAEKDEYIGEAYELLEKLSADELKRLEYESRQKSLRDYNSQMHSAEKRGFALGEKRGMKQGMERGMAQGIAQGMAQGMTQGIAQGMTQGIALTKQIFMLERQGKTIEEIAAICETTVETVKEVLSF